MSKMISKQTATVFFRNEVFTIAPPKLYYRSTFGGRFKRSLTAFNSWKILLPTTSSYNAACRVEAGIMRRVVLWDTACNFNVFISNQSIFNCLITGGSTLYTCTQMSASSTINYTLKGHTAILVNFHSYTNLRCPLFLESALLLPQGGETIL